jgi:hypothetical protein
MIKHAPPRNTSSDPFQKKGRTPTIECTAKINRNRSLDRLPFTFTNLTKKSQHPIRKLSLFGSSSARGFPAQEQCGFPRQVRAAQDDSIVPHCRNREQTFPSILCLS